MTYKEFLTNFAPAIVFAISMALDISACRETKPLNWTIPLNVLTLISVDSRPGSLKIAALTFVVITLSSIYSPVLSVVDVDAQPDIDRDKITAMAIQVLFSCVMV